MDIKNIARTVYESVLTFIVISGFVATVYILVKFSDWRIDALGF